MESLIDFKRLKRIKEDEESNIPDITGLSKKKNKSSKKQRENLQSKIISINSEINTKDIVQALFMRFSNHRYLINNAFIFNDIWESDFITVTESMYVYEIECKMSKSDFSDDFNKVEKHAIFESQDVKHNNNRPNKFFYCTPRGMIPSYQIPEYAGLMEVSRDQFGVLVCNTVKEAPFLHKEDIFSSIKDRLLQKLSWRYRDIMLNDYDNAINIKTKEEIL